MANGNKIYKGNGGSPLLEIKGDKIYKGNGGSPLLQIKGKKIHKGNGGGPLYYSSERLNSHELIAILYQLGAVQIKGAGKSSGKGGCFIATATMGDYNHPVVMQLREFRDQYLLERYWGKKFIKYYYKFGPYPAKVISNSNFLKKVSYIFIVKPLYFVVRKFMNKKE